MGLHTYTFVLAGGQHSGCTCCCLVVWVVVKALLGQWAQSSYIAPPRISTPVMVCRLAGGWSQPPVQQPFRQRGVRARSPHTHTHTDTHAHTHTYMRGHVSHSFIQSSTYPCDSCLEFCFIFISFFFLTRGGGASFSCSLWKRLNTRLASRGSLKLSVCMCHAAAQTCGGGGACPCFVAVSPVNHMRTNKNKTHQLTCTQNCQRQGKNPKEYVKLQTGINELLNENTTSMLKNCSRL